MANKKNFWYVVVFTGKGAKFVTKINYSDRTAEWNTDEKPLLMSQGEAKDLAMGLCCNFNFALPVCNYFELTDHPYRYNIGHFEWVMNETKNK